MSGQVSLVLRPPPNVEHVDGQRSLSHLLASISASILNSNLSAYPGYPGIPPGPNRPQASVKGSVELRTSPAGIKAKWVRIALNKIETLPGVGSPGGGGVFTDFVGPSPVALWQANEGEEYGLLGSRDFQFNIRIPEATPPSVNLASDLSGIRYELVASVCIKGKKLFLRRRKSSVITTVTGIIIDKHELHSTWPIYNQPEARNLTQDGVTLHVERDTTCYGPGDKMSVVATVKSESMNTIILRGFEILLRETSIFRGGPYTNGGKKSAPQVRVLSIGEAKVPVNVTLYGGNHHTSELACVLSQHHTTTTLNTARHIDVTYVLCVKALMGTGATIVMELPVIISNWQRNVSTEALRRIGPVPSLSLTSPIHSVSDHGHAATFGAATGHTRQTSNDYLNQTMPAPNTIGGRTAANEFGGFSAGFTPSRTANTPLTSYNGPTSESAPPSQLDAASSRLPQQRPRGGSNSTSQNRLTIVNDINGEVPVSAAERRPGTGSRRPGSAGGGAGNKWMSAEDEKRMLYERAKDAVEKVQGASGRGPSPPPQQPARGPSPPSTSNAPQAPAPQPSTTKRWPTAEEEKLELYERAQAAVQRTQGLSSSDPISTTHGRSASVSDRGGSSSRVGNSSTVPPAASGSSTSISPIVPVQQPKPQKPIQQYPTAEQEKAAMKKYEEARDAVARTQAAGEYGGSSTAAASTPVAYEALYPPAVSAAPVPAPSTGGAFSEKERLRRAYEAQDAQATAAIIRERQAAQAASIQAQRLPSSGGGSTPPNYSPPPFTAGSSFSKAQSQPLSEKEILRRQLEAQDRAAQAAFAAVAATTGPSNPTQSSQQNLQRNASVQQPAMTSPMGSSNILSAVEEKAMLAARYASEDRGAGVSNAPPARANTTSPPYQYPQSNGSSALSPATNGRTSAPPSSSTPHSPPPLKPRPPKEYIQETQEEDARVSKALGNGAASLRE